MAVSAQARDSNFTVVVPTHGRAGLVRALLESLAAARARYGGLVEVFVLDSSPPEEARVIREECSRWQAEYHEAENHVPRKRNLGIRLARYDIVLFTDSDCQVAPNIFDEHLAVYSAHGAEAASVLGLTEWVGGTGFAWRVLGFAPSFTAAFSLASWLKEAPWGTCTNLSVRRGALLEIGGFDETLPLKVYGEDVDLGLRLNNAGYRILCTPRAVVRHDGKSLSAPLALLRKALATGRADYHLGVRHPDRLAPEYPSLLTLTILLLLAAASSALLGRPARVLAAPLVSVLALVLGQAFVTILLEKGEWRSLPYRAAAALLDLLFEAGRIAESLRHGRVFRLWMKFVYVKEQLVAERPRRVAQMWAAVFTMLLIILLFR